MQVNNFLEKLKGITDPETKRKIVGEEFVQVFTEFAKQMVHSTGLHKAHFIQM